MSVCPFVRLSVSVSVCLSVCLLVRLSVSVRLSVCMALDRGTGCPKNPRDSFRRRLNGGTLRLHLHEEFTMLANHRDEGTLHTSVLPVAIPHFAHPPFPVSLFTTQNATTSCVPSFFCPRSKMTSEVVRRALGLYFQ